MFFPQVFSFFSVLKMMLRFLFVLISFFGMTVSTSSSNVTSCVFDVDDIDITKLQIWQAELR